jgi:TPR repeat protein
MYFRGHEVPQDYAQADYWYEKAADQGLANAEYAIGDLYYYGYTASRRVTRTLWLGIVRQPLRVTLRQNTPWGS